MEVNMVRRSSYAFDINHAYDYAKIYRVDTLKLYPGQYHRVTVNRFRRVPGTTSKARTSRVYVISPTRYAMLVKVLEAQS